MMESAGATTSLTVAEIFASIQGESTFAGRPCAFVRTTGCNLRCDYCDTQYAFEGGTPMAISAVRDRLLEFGLPLIEVTGGEPLLQPGVLPLMRDLCDRGCTVLLETNGSLDISVVDRRVHRIVDFKSPASGEEPRNDYGNIERLTGLDEVKLVVATRGDYNWARSFILDQRLHERCVVLLSPVTDRLEPRDLADWMVADRLEARLQLQLHKILWGKNAVGV